MGLNKTADGRYVVGLGVTDGNDYKGGIGKRDMVIQYTEDGATEQSMEYLAFLKDYAVAHAGAGKLILPEGVSVWLATGDKLTAVEADDIKLTEDTFSVGAVSYSLDDDEWTFGTPSSGGIVPTPEAEDDGKVLTASSDGTASWQTPSGGGGVEYWDATYGEDYLLHLTHSFNDAASAISSGKMVVLHYMMSETEDYYLILFALQSFPEDDGYYATFGYGDIGSPTVRVFTASSATANLSEAAPS